MKKRPVGIVLACILVLFLMFMFATHDWSSQKGRSEQNPAQMAPTSSPSPQTQPPREAYNDPPEKECTNPVFTEYFVDPQSVQKVGQIGVVHGSGLYIVERSYVSIRSELSGQKIPVYAPTEMTLRTGAYYKDPGAPRSSLPDYALRFDAGCQVEVSFAHLKELVPAIADQMPEIRPDSRDTQMQPILFKPGELIGYFIHQPGGVAGFDFITRDKKFVNTFINKERYEGHRAGNLINGVCPYDFYTGDKKETYYNLLGGAGGTLFKVKECGSASIDKAGTISGMWFLSKEITGAIYDNYKEGEYGSALSIAGDEESITIGNIGKERLTRVYPINPTYKLPTEVTGEHCYQLQDDPSTPKGYVYFKVIDVSTMDVYYSPSGLCPPSFPTTGAKRYWK